jgi:cytoskeletal protein CcmA (bactofilin family)
MLFAKRKKRPFIEVTKLSSLIAEDVEITGDVSFASGIRIDGRVKGNLIARDAQGETRALLVLSEKGHIEGSVRCGDAVINGTVIGDLDVEHFLELQSSSRVSGTIRYQHLQMDVGAAVRGQLVKVDSADSAQAPDTSDKVIELGVDTAAQESR